MYQRKERKNFWFYCALFSLEEPRQETSAFKHSQVFSQLQDNPISIWIPLCLHFCSGHQFSCLRLWLHRQPSSSNVLWLPRKGSFALLLLSLSAPTLPPSPPHLFLKQINKGCETEFIASQITSAGEINVHSPFLTLRGKKVLVWH